MGGAPMAWPRHPMLGGPTPLSLLFFAYSFVRNLSHRGSSRRVTASAGRRTPERKELSGAGIRRGNSLPEGKSTPSSSSSSWTSSPPPSSSSPPSSPPSPPLDIVTAVAIWPVIKDLLRIGAQFVGYRDYASKAEEKLAEANERANTLAQQLEQSEKARKKAESDAVDARAEADKAKADAAGVEDLRKRLHTAETSLGDHIAAQSAREEAILKRVTTQSRRFVSKTAQKFQLDEPVNDPLLDALSLPRSSWMKEEPETFLDLAKCFNPAEDLGLKVRHENMKVAVENTVALVADSQQSIDWSKVGDTEQIEQSRWRSLIKAAKPNTRKILAYIGIKPSSTPSSSKPEV
ncbi:hypothetical protein QYE76_038768 [Lolium multiflorum]|uniref:Uncharacterized protein n=1 Tax=Lolium multiflorum TaxID=4521 RepID=A0AAD8T8P3_LOLMU|nr:hypothetical protein QYE76_038768 [Lolium multiflorum]